jgi:hypothetical protein
MDGMQYETQSNNKCGNLTSVYQNICVKTRY